MKYAILSALFSPLILGTMFGPWFAKQAATMRVYNERRARECNDR